MKFQRHYIKYVFMIVLLTILSQTATLTTPKTNNGENKYETVQKNKDFSFEATDFAAISYGNEQIRTPFQFSNLQFRKTGFSYFLRNLHFANYLQIKFNISLSIHTTKHSLNESAGYYLFHLRKLLI